MPTHVRYLQGQSGELIFRNRMDVHSIVLLPLSPSLQLQRHGSRFPTSGLDKRIRLALSKIQAVIKYKSSKLTFLDNYQYSLNTGDLLPYGASEWVIRSLMTGTPLSKVITGAIFLEVPYSSDIVTLQIRLRLFAYRAPNA